MPEELSYRNLVDYEIADPAKVLAQQHGLATSSNMPYGYTEVAGTRGEPAYVFDMGESYGVLVQEGLGTKSLVAKDVYEATGKSYFAAIAQDTVAAVINDLVSVGARPVALNAYWSSSDYGWLATPVSGGISSQVGGRPVISPKVSWGGGGDPGPSGRGRARSPRIGRMCFRSHKAEERPPDKVARSGLGDAVVLIASNGVHANGLSLLRDIARRLEKGYQTTLDDGTELGSGRSFSRLTSTPIS